MKIGLPSTQESIFLQFNICLCVSLIVLIASGCSKSRFESTVTGIVKLDGAPIGPGVIQFVPNGNSHNPATGAIQVDGSYQLNTSNEVGLDPGEYRVTVAIYDQPELAPGERAALGSAVLKTPEKYLSMETTDLKFTVAPGENKIEVPLVTE